MISNRIRPVRHRLFFLPSCLPVCLIASVIIPASAGDAVAGDGDPSVARQVRSLLSDRCFQCHGPDSSERQGGLRLDVRESAFSESDSGQTAIVPGDVAGSELLNRVRSADPDLRMPPSDSGKSLSAEEIRLLDEWIRDGAEWSGHWAFEPIVRPAPPQPVHAEGVVNDIDRFVRQRLEAEGLIPSAQADRVSLIRRVTLDLTGLPPTIDEVDAFLNDGSPDAYERVVERLLASDAYGEHMARYWLDAARYGDTHGLHLDNYREMWAYRDWVIDAFNANMPFDRFTIEQLAGDLLENPTENQLIATGFNRCHVTTSEGGSIAEEVRMRNVVDRTTTAATVFMGLTFECTRCHDHKFDPFTMKDFYSLYAFFNSLDGNPLDGNRKDHAPVMTVLTPEMKKQAKAIEAQKTAVAQQLDQFLASVDLTEPESPGNPQPAPPEETLVVDDGLPPGAKPQGNGNPPWQFVSAPEPVFSGSSSHKRTAPGLSQHLFTDASPALEISAGDVLFAYVYLDPESPPKEIMLQWNDGSWEHRAYWGGNQINWGSDNSDSRRRIGDLPQAGQWVRLEVPADAVGLKPGARVHGWAFTQFDGTVYWDKAGRRAASGTQLLYNSFAQWRRAVSDGSDESAAADDQLKQARELLSEGTPESEQKLKRLFAENSYAGSYGRVRELKAEMAMLDQQLAAQRNGAPTTLIFKEKSAPEPAWILTRGEYDQKGESVARATPVSLPPMSEDLPLNRLGLAKWLVSPEHPLTARVTVNRIWQQFFGTGIVRTTEDFGSQAEIPSHPLLLDWLAAEFRSPEVPGAGHAWDMKHIVRLIVTSSAYRQTAQVLPQTAAADPQNRLLSRGPRFRLDAEVLRDQALAVSGLLQNEVGGPSVKPPQPDGLWFAVGYSGSNTVRFKADTGPEKVHRRTLYTFIKRTAPPPQMSTFDAPSRESCVVRRERTNSPLQALLLLNDPQYVECFRGLATRAIREAGPEASDRAAWMLRTAILRRVSDRESARLAADFESFLSEFRQDPEAARQLLEVGEAEVPSDLPADELAAWTVTAGIVMNLDEFLNK